MPRNSHRWRWALVLAILALRTGAAGEVRRDRQGDPLPTGALARLGTVRLRHNGPIVFAAFTAGGKQILTVAQDHSCIFWDAATGKEVRRFNTANDLYKPIAMSPDGKILMYSDDEENLYRDDSATGQERPAQFIEGWHLTHLRFSPDGKILAVGCNQPLPQNDQGERGRPPSAILLWDFATGKTRHTLKGHERANLAQLAFSPDGKTLAASFQDQAQVRLSDTATGQEKRSWTIPEKSIWSLAFSPDGATLATSSHDGRQGRLRFWDAATGRQRREAVRPAQPLELAYSPDGKRLLGVEAGKLHVYDAATGQDVRSFAPPSRELGRFALAPDGQTVAVWGLGAHAAEVFDASTGQPRHRFAGHRGPINGLAYSDDGATVFSSAGHPSFATSNGSFGEAALWHDKKAANVQLWDAATARPLGRLGANCGALSALARSPSGKLLALGGAGDGLIHLWDAVARKEVRCLRGHEEAPFGFSWSADSQTLLSCDVESVRVWDVATGRQRRVLAWQNGSEDRAALSPDGKYLALGAEGMSLWDIAIGKEVRRFPFSKSREVLRLPAFSPDGRTLAAAGYLGVVYLWDVASGKEVGQIPTGCAELSKLLFTADGRGLLTGYFDGSIRLWEVATQKLRRQFDSRGSLIISSLALAPDGRSFAAGNYDSTILLWDLTGRLSGGIDDKEDLDKKQLAHLWEDVQDVDAAKAYRALWRLALAPRAALPFLRQHLRPEPRLDAAARKQVKQWLGELDSADYAVRQKATRGLERLGEAPVALLRRELAARPSLEVRRRIEQLLEKCTRDSPQRLRMRRALEAVENMRTAEARHYLETLAAGAEGAWLTQETQAARQRCQGQP